MQRTATLLWTLALFVTLPACGDDSGGGGQPESQCGNGFCEQGEDLESCPEDCTCGNGVLDPGEECDGDELGEATCADLGFGGGTLACREDCSFDTSGCEPLPTCGNGVLDPGEECDGVDLDRQDCLSLGFEGGTLVCTADCTFDTSGCCNSDCDEEGAARCDGDSIQTCTRVEAGCLAWTVTTDCSAESKTCWAGGEGPTCVEPCDDQCPEQGARGCDGDVVSECVADERGCLAWQAVQDCTQEGRVCHQAGQTAGCVVGPGNSCDEAIAVQDTIHLSGENFHTDYWNDYDFNGTDCGYGAGQEVIFAVELGQGDGVWLSETGGMDAVWRVLPTCDATAACLLSQDNGEEGLTFVADATGTYYIVLEDYWADANNDWEDGDASYDVTIQILQPEAGRCADGRDNDRDGATDCADSDCAGQNPCENPEQTCDDNFDNDGDGTADCADPDCFGRTGCETESICGDGADNDADGATDCSDPDCTGRSPCENPEQTCDDGFDNDADGATDCADPDCGNTTACLRHTLWQALTAEDPSDDFLGHRLSFSPDANAPAGYSWQVPRVGRDYPIAPGSLGNPQSLSLGDDACTSVYLDFTFTFFGQDYDSVFVCSNGKLTFGAEDSDTDGSLSSFVEVPKIAALDRDLNPASGGTITVEKTADLFLVTYEQVPLYGNEAIKVSFQVALASTGEVSIYYKSCLIPSNYQSGYVGIIPGNPGTLDIGSTDFLPPPSPVINEVFYAQPGDDTGEFVELAGRPNASLDGLTLVHWDGAGGSVLWTADLSGRSLDDRGFFLVGASGVPGVDLTWTDLGLTETNVLQDGPDSLGLLANWDTNNATGDLVDAVEWGAGANPSHAETAPATPVPSEEWNTSIGRSLDRLDFDENMLDFTICAWPTPDDANMASPTAQFRIMGSVHSAQAGQFPIAIPDNDATGVSVTFDTASLGWFDITTVDSVYVGVRIQHTWRGDLIVQLTSPSGRTVRLHDQSGGSDDDIVGIYDTTLQPAESLSAFNGDTAQGTWTLKVSDNAGGDTGTIQEVILWFNGH